ncbi:MAG: hypothetical protein GXX09_12650, partial [Syntrophomonadaceae bacterium]|nr:hypothetical protein [Syntrophomonadaceae bacterium]
MNKKILSIVLSLCMVLLIVPGPAVAIPAATYSPKATVSGTQVTVSGTAAINGSPVAGRDITLRIVDALARDILADQVKSGVGGVYTFGPYTLANGSYTASTGGMGGSQSIQFTLGEQGLIPVTGVELNKSGVTIRMGENEILVATVSPANATNKAVTWTSSDTSVATVDSTGKVTGVGAGIATITVTTVDGGKTATCEVTVTKPVEAATGETVTVSDEPLSITIPVNGSDAKIKVTPNSQLPLVGVAAATSLGTVGMTIPAGTKASGPAGWDGTITPPTVKPNNSVTVVPDAGKTATVSAVIEVGFGDVPLTFDKAVRLLIPGQAGKDAGYYRGGTFTKITGVLSADTQAVGDALPPGGDGKINVGNDLVIWTKHFTSFVTYTQTDSGSSGGGGGGYTPSAVTSTTGSATVPPSAGGKIGLGSDAVIDIPAYALKESSSVEVKVAKVTSPPATPPGARLASDVYEFTVDGKGTYNFAKNVTITLAFNSASISADETPVLHYYDESMSKWVNIGGTVSGSTISATVDHLTKVAVLVVKKEVKPETPKPVVNLKDIAGHWAEAKIKQLVASGAIGGYPDGSFKPDKQITRAEFATVLVKAFNLAPQSGKVFG